MAGPHNDRIDRNLAINQWQQVQARNHCRGIRRLPVEEWGAGFALLLGLALVPLLVSLARADEIEKREETYIERNDRTRLVIQNINGEVTVRGTGGDVIVIRSNLVASGGNREEAGKRLGLVALRVEEDSDEVKIVLSRQDDGSRKWWSRFACAIGGKPIEGLRADLVVEAPADMDLSIDLTSGNVDAAGMTGLLEITTASGDVDIEGGSEVVVDVTRGDVYVADIDRLVEVDGISGNLELRRCTGTVRVDLTNGDILGRHLEGRIMIDGTAGSARLFQVVGDVSFDAVSGDLLLDDFEGSLEADTFSGSVRAVGRVAERGHLLVETISGAVDISLLDLSRASFRLESDHGVIDAGMLGRALRLEREGLLVGTLGEGPGPEIRLQTRNGDITLARR